MITVKILTSEDEGESIIDSAQVTLEIPIGISKVTYLIATGDDVTGHRKEQMEVELLHLFVGNRPYKENDCYFIRDTDDGNLWYELKPEGSYFLWRI